VLALGLGFTVPAKAESPPGVTAHEIKIGNTQSYSGPNSSTAIVGRIQQEYFAALNQKGGINGRKVQIVSLDDGYSPPRALEQTRKLVEQENVLAIMATNGTGPNAAIQKYLNAKHVPQLLAISGAARWDDPKNFPWTTAFFLPFRAEGEIYGRFIRKTRPDAKIAVLYQNDDLGRDYLQGLQTGLGPAASQMIVKTATYEFSDPSIDSQIAILQSSGADVFVDFSLTRFAVLAMRKTSDIGWKPLHVLASVGNNQANISLVGADRVQGMVSSLWLKQVGDPRYADDPRVKDYFVFMAANEPKADPRDLLSVLSYTIADVMARVLQSCGDDLSRENLLTQATSFKDVQLPLMIDGITLNNSPEHYTAFSKAQLVRLEGERWVPIGDPMGSD